MSIVYKNKALSLILNNMLEELPYIYSHNAFQKVLEKQNLSESELQDLKTGLKKIRKRVEIDWNKKAVVDLYTANDVIFKPSDLLSAWCTPTLYLSHYSALYFNGLINQRPTVHYLSQDILERRKKDPQEIDPLIMKQSFMKSPRITTNFGTYENIKYYFIDRLKKTEGVVESSHVSDDVEYKFYITNIERTLVDSIVAPQYSGGLPTIIKAFKASEIRIEIMKEVYDSLNLTYPFWQNIGFIFKLIDSPFEKTWKSFFKKPEMEFFIDHRYRSNWELDKNWKIYYPPGLK